MSGGYKIPEFDRVDRAFGYVAMAFLLAILIACFASMGCNAKDAPQPPPPPSAEDNARGWAKNMKIEATGVDCARECGWDCITYCSVLFHEPDGSLNIARLKCKYPGCRKKCIFLSFERKGK